MSRFYSYEEFLKDIETFTKQLHNQQFDCIVAITRGGLTLAHFLSNSLDIRKIYCIGVVSYEKNKKMDKLTVFNIPNVSNCSKILVVDDISDSGDTFLKVVEIFRGKEIKTLSIFYKSDSKFIPDFTIKKSNEWIEFFWEKKEIK